MSDLIPWYCDEHGLVMHADFTGSVEFSVLLFCPVCNREIHRRDALSELEIDRASSFDEWAGSFDEWLDDPSG